MPQSKDNPNEARHFMKTIARTVGSFLSFFFALIGIVLMARGLEIEIGPLSSNLSGWTLYHLVFADTFQFYLGCGIVSASLTFLGSQRCNPN
jgi:hypothetical protein